MNQKPTHAARPRVLLAEDNSVHQQVALALLSRYDCQVELANNGVQATELATHNAFDLIVMDCQMPHMDGFAATHAIRAHHKAKSLPHTPIIAFTAAAVASDIEQCFTCGMNDHLPKPLTPEALEKMLTKWIPTREFISTRSDTANQNTDPAVLDQSIITSLINVMGDEFAEIIADYLNTAPALLADIDHAIAAHNTEALAKSAHSLKSPSGQVGAVLLSHLMHDLEKMAHTQNLTHAHATLTAAKILFGDVKRELEKVIVSETI